MAKDEFGKTSAGAARMIILIVLLLVVAGAFAFDKLSVKPKFDAAFARVQELDAQVPQPKDVVHRVINREPASVTHPRDDITVETYSWIRGFPILTYDIHIVYTKKPDSSEEFFYTTIANRTPDDRDFPNLKREQLDIPDPESVRGLERAGGPDPLAGKKGDDKGDQKPEDEQDKSAGDDKKSEQKKEKGDPGDKS